MIFFLRIMETMLLQLDFSYRFLHKEPSGHFRILQYNCYKFSKIDKREGIKRLYFISEFYFYDASKCAKLHCKNKEKKTPPTTIKQDKIKCDNLFNECLALFYFACFPSHHSISHVFPLTSNTHPVSRSYVTQN